MKTRFYQSAFFSLLFFVVLVPASKSQGTASAPVGPAPAAAPAVPAPAVPAPAALPVKVPSPAMQALLEKSRQAFKDNKPDEALRLLDEMIVQARDENDVAAEIGALNDGGMILESQEKYAEAGIRYEAKLKLLRTRTDAKKDVALEILTLFQIGVMRHLAGNEAGAREAYDDVRKISEEKYLAEIGLSVLGDIYERDGRHKAAIMAYEDALSYARAPGNDRSWEPQLLARLANARSSMGKQKMSPELVLQSGHNAPVLTCAMSPDGALIVSGDSDGTLKVWNAHAGELIRTLSGHIGAVTKVAFSSSGILASAGADSTLKLWNPRTGALVRTLFFQTAASAVAFSPDGRLLAGSTFTGTVKLWDAQTGAELRLCEASGVVSALAFSSDGGVLALVGGDQKDGKIFGQIALNDVDTGKRLRTLDEQTEVPISVAFSPDGKTLGTCSGNGTSRLWDWQSGKLLHTLAGSIGNAAHLSFSPDGTILAVTSTGEMRVKADDDIKLWDVATGTLRRLLHTNNHWPVAVIWTPDGRSLVSGGLDKSVDVWNATTGLLETRLPAYTQFVLSVEFLPDGSLTTGEVRVGLHGARAEYKVWDMQTGEFKNVLARYAAPDIAHINGAFSIRTGILIAVRDQTNLEVTDTRANRLLWKKKVHEADISYTAISPDGKTIATTGADKTLKIWDVATGKLLNTFSNLKDDLDKIVFSPDSRMIAAGIMNDPEDKSVNVWDLKTGKLKLLTGNEKGIYNIAFSPDSRTVASAGYDATVRVWDLDTGRLKHTLSHKATSFGIEKEVGVLGLAWSSDGALLATASNDGVFRIWNAQSGALQRILSEPGGTLFTFSLAFSPDNRRLVGGAYDGAAHIWDVQSGKPIVTLLSLPPAGRFSGLAAEEATTPNTSQGKPADIAPDAQGVVTDLTDIDDYLVATADGYYSGSAAADRYVRFRLGDDLFPAESFQSRYYRPDLVREVLAGKPVPAVGDFKGAFPPLAGFAPLPNGNKLSGNTATITLQASDDSNVKRVELFVNGTRVDAKALEVGSKALEIGSKTLELGDRTIPDAHKSLQNFTATVPLPAQGTSIRVQAIAYDDDGLQSPRTEMLFTRDPQATATGKLLGVCVGVSEYQDSRLNLKYADRDASALSEILNRQRGIYSAANVTTLVNAAATRDNVKKELDNLIEKTTKADTVIVMLSGHGWRSDERNFYFATHEVNRADVAASALPWTDVVSRLQRLSEKSKRVIVLLDACHSGSAATNEELVKAVLSANAGVLIFASSKGSEVSLELGELQHGAFTQALTEGIEGRAAPTGEQNITTLDLLSYVARRVKSLTGDTQHPQVPFLQDFDTDAPIITNQAQMVSVAH